MTNVSEWSVTAGLNNSSPPDGWPEGMARSAVNDCAREMMAALAKWYQDTRGSLVTAGSSNAYTLTTNNTHTALSDVPPLFFRVDRVNTGAVTLNVDGLGAKSWFKGPYKQDYISGELLQDQMVSVLYNSTSDQFETQSNLRAYTPQGHLFGLTMSNSAGDLTNDIDVAAGICTSDDALDTMRLASSITKRLDSGWVVGTNQGGLDTGSIADTTYHVFLIKRPDTGVVDVLFSTSTSPTMPANYTLKRRIGSIIRASSAIVLFWQDGDRVLRKAVGADLKVGVASAAATLTAVGVPLGIMVQPVMRFLVDSTSGTATVGLADARDTTQANEMKLTADLGGLFSYELNGGIFTNTSGQIYIRYSTSLEDVAVLPVGWIDDRGRSY